MKYSYISILRIFCLIPVCGKVKPVSGKKQTAFILRSDHLHMHNIIPPDIFVNRYPQQKTILRRNFMRLTYYPADISQKITIYSVRRAFRYSLNSFPIYKNFYGINQKKP